MQLILTNFSYENDVQCLTALDFMSIYFSVEKMWKCQSKLSYLVKSKEFLLYFQSLGRRLMTLAPDKLEHRENPKTSLRIDTTTLAKSRHKFTTF